MNQCTKIRFTGASKARKAHRRASWRLRVYQCPDCHGWHVTNQEKRENRGNGERSRW